MIKTLNKYLPFIKEEKIDIDKNTKEYNLFASWNVKYLLLQNSLNYLKSVNKNTYSLLDLASGRGNDINRWIKLGIKRVIGIELSKEQMLEAIRRTKKHLINISYINGSMTDVNLIRNTLNKYNNGNKFDIITNNFALNQIFNSEENINNFFKVISLSLNDESLFIGTATDGDMLEFLFKLNENYDCKLYSIKKVYNDTDKFKKYKFKINTPYFNDDYIEEYIINKQKFLDYAHKYDLIPFTTINGVDPLSNFCKIPIIKNELDNQYMNRPIGIASLYFTFSFIKKRINYDYTIIKNTNEIKNHNSSFFVISEHKIDNLEFLYNPIIYTNGPKNTIYDTIYDKYDEPTNIIGIIIHREILQKLEHTENLEDLFLSIKNKSVPYVIRNVF